MAAEPRWSPTPARGLMLLGTGNMHPFGTKFVPSRYTSFGLERNRWLNRATSEGSGGAVLMPPPRQSHEVRARVTAPSSHARASNEAKNLRESSSRQTAGQDKLFRKRRLAARTRRSSERPAAAGAAPADEGDGDVVPTLNEGADQEDGGAELASGGERNVARSRPSPTRLAIASRESVGPSSHESRTAISGETTNFQDRRSSSFGPGRGTWQRSSENSRRHPESLSPVEQLVAKATERVAKTGRRNSEGGRLEIALKSSETASPNAVLLGKRETTAAKVLAIQYAAGGASIVGERVVHRKAPRQERKGAIAREERGRPHMRRRRTRLVAEREEIFEIGPEGMVLGELSRRLVVSERRLITMLLTRGIRAISTSVLAPSAVKQLAAEFGTDVLEREESGAGDSGIDHHADTHRLSRRAAVKDEESVSRPPVVTVMGHVDHGKTTLLDCIRRTRVAAREKGGITQSIGAYTCQVDVQSPGDEEERGQGLDTGAERSTSSSARDKKKNKGSSSKQATEGGGLITFLDTPGHVAFSAMRARGASVTDVVVLVVAADEGVMPQTREAAALAKSAGVPVVVALNKMDRPGADPERAMGALAELDLVPEEWGGRTPCVPICAKDGTGMHELLEMILLVAELEADPKARVTGPATGAVLEGNLDPKKGPCASLLVQQGTLRVGDIVVAGTAHGRVRALTAVSGPVGEAKPSTAAAMLGLSAVPEAGTQFRVVPTEQAARAEADAARAASRAARLESLSGDQEGLELSDAGLGGDEDSIEALLAVQGIASDGAAASTTSSPTVSIILRADASGTVEAAQAALRTLASERGDGCRLQVLSALPGEVGRADVELAFAAAKSSPGGSEQSGSAAVLAFRTKLTPDARAAARSMHVTVLAHDVIYSLLDAVTELLSAQSAGGGRLDPASASAEARVLAVFASGKDGAVAGCAIERGRFGKGDLVKVVRGDPPSLVHEGRIASLRRGRNSVDSVEGGVECGLFLKDFHGWTLGDRILLMPSVAN